MIIGVSGKAQSGKDEFGKIYQYIMAHYSAGYSWKPNEEDYKSWLKNGHQKHSHIEIKKYADKLKDIVCILLNCTREDLEDEDFKNEPLGDSWDKWELRWHSEESVDGVYTTYGEALDALEELGGSWPDAGDAITQIVMTPRLLLQLLGTECGRKIIHPDIWVNSLMSEYDSTIVGIPLGKAEWFESKGYGDINKVKEDRQKYAPLNAEYFKYLRSFSPLWIITDVRFPNEVFPIEDREGFVVRMVRYPKFLIRSSSTTEYVREPFDIENPIHRRHYEGECRHDHVSERALDEHDFVHYIYNNGTIGELIEQVMLVMKEENIIG